MENTFERFDEYRIRRLQQGDSIVSAVTDLSMKSAYEVILRSKFADWV